MGNSFNPRTNIRAALALPLPPSERIDTSKRADYLPAIQNWNGRLGQHLRYIRVLEAVRWSDSVEHEFLAFGCREMPQVTRDDYRTSDIAVEIPERLADLRRLEREISRRLGAEHPAARLLLRRCRSSQAALRLIAGRGTSEFVWLSRELYGSSLNSRTIRERLLRLVSFLENSVPEASSPNLFSSEEATRELARRLRKTFSDDTIRVETSDRLSSLACAGNGYLKLREDARFSPAEIDLLEAHEGWAHLGTSRNGNQQPIFTVLSKCSPGATSTQEGMALLTELMAGVCHPERRQRLALRLRAVMMAEEGADFLQVHRFFNERLANDREAYRQTARVFRGSLPRDLGPFTKDLSYGLGLIELSTRLRHLGADVDVAIKLLFAGKTCIEDLSDLTALHANGVLASAEFIPPPFRDGQRLRTVLRELPTW
ncbi:MAG: flavohemoglobin expression-modulating QEGLA motif protein [Planctomycetes bacterium]|nr:flavohemoglobin expression-modulating QEGLA motif protein [Planctomycetota bacterium]